LAMAVLIPLNTLFPHSYWLFGEPDNVVAPSPPENAGYLRHRLRSQWFTGASGDLVLMLLATVLGAGLISEEVNQGTIFPLLDKPVGRGRRLLTKYTVGAGGELVSTGLLWLGLLLMLGTSLLLSVAPDSALLAVVGTFLVWMLTSVALAFAAQQAAASLSTQNAPPVTVGHPKER
jgi:ABC-type transport system involved in multi-copper enzyme maturation permease subunit